MIAPRRSVLLLALAAVACEKRQEPVGQSTTPEPAAAQVLETIELSSAGPEWAGYTIKAGKGSTVAAEGARARVVGQRSDPNSPVGDVIVSREKQDVAALKLEQLTAAEIYGGKTKFHQQTKFVWTKETADAFEWDRTYSDAPTAHGFRQRVSVGGEELWCWPAEEAAPAHLAKLRDMCASLAKK